MNIAQAAKHLDLTAATLRYYERIGLIPPVNRKDNGIRDYEASDLQWIEFIKCMRDAGLSIESLIEYTALFMEGERTVEARKHILMEEQEKLVKKRDEIDATIKKLEGKIRDYDGRLLRKETELRQQ